MKTRRKLDFPLTDIRRYLEPGPIVLVSSAWKGERNLMTMGWHCMLGFSPALFGCYIWQENHSHGLIKRSRECVINLPTADMIDTVVGIGNCSGTEGDKFERFGLTAVPAHAVGAPLVKECHASFECRLQRHLPAHSFFIWEVVKAHVAASPRRPRTLHYRGEGEFMLSGEHASRRRQFKPGML